MVPNHARYQLRYTPKSLFIIMTVPLLVKRKVAPPGEDGPGIASPDGA